MTLSDACPACSTRFDAQWIALGRRCRSGVERASFLCPRCTLGRVETAGAVDLHTEYHARVQREAAPGATWEDEMGRVRSATAADLQAILSSRIMELKEALRIAPTNANVLVIGTGNGAFAVAAKHELGVHCEGVEPVTAWCAETSQLGIPCTQTTIEALSSDSRFGVVVEHDLLQHLSDPLAHLQAIRQRLAPGGVALIEAPNLIGAAGMLEDPILRSDAPTLLTPRGLITLCRRAGLAPVAVVAQSRLRVLCRAAEPRLEVPPGPDAVAVAQAAWGNELRLSVKRVMAQKGAGERVLVTVRDIYRRCRHAPTRADIAIEIAVGCERGSDYDAAALWLARSLQDRADPEVQAMLAAVEQVRARVRNVWATPAAEPEVKPVAPVPVAC